MGQVIGSNKVKISIIDKDESIGIFLNALGFQVPKGELELLLNGLRWEKMLRQGVPGTPEITPKNIAKFKKDHIEFMNQWAQKEHAKSKNNNPEGQQKSGDVIDLDQK